MNHILDEMQEKMYEFEQNKKNNLIFHGILADHPETPDGQEEMKYFVGDFFSFAG